MAGNLKFMRRRVLAIGFMCLLIIPLVVPGQTGMRVVHLLSYGNEPAKLEFKIAEQTVVPQKPFIADDDWLKDLSWGMKNSSDKPIVWVEVNLDFHGLGNSEAERVYKYRYGQRPDAQDANGEPRLIKPGETANFKLSDAEYNELKQFVEQKQPSEGISVVMSVVEMRIAAVFFEDKSMWKDGKLSRSESSNSQNMGQVEDYTSKPRE